MQAKNPPINLIQKEKTQWNTSWPGILEFEVSTLQFEQLYHKVCLLILSTELCLWNKYSKISINRCWQLLYFEVKSIVENNTKSLKIYVVETKVEKNIYS
jgi:hypothetical protein